MLAEGISVIVRNETLQAHYPGGVAGYVRDCPNATFCTDGKISRVGFMAPPDVGAFIQTLTKHGLVFFEGEMCRDIVVVDQLTGPTAPCEWIGFGEHFDGYSFAFLNEEEFDGRIALPEGWTLEKSLSRNHHFVRNEDIGDRLEFRRHEDGQDVHFDRQRGVELFTGRVSFDNPPVADDHQAASSAIDPAGDSTRGPRPVASGALAIYPCRDSHEMGEDRRRHVRTPRDVARDLGRSAVEAIEDGFYRDSSGRAVDWTDAVGAAVAARESIPPDAPLPDPPSRRYVPTIVGVANETTLRAAKNLVETGAKTLALNFANGIHPGGGFLHGARAQEEGLCRSSALYATLAGDPMYEHHRQRPRPDSTDWAILSPNVPVFRSDDGTPLDEPWLLSFLTCAAPVAAHVGQPESGDLLQERIHRVLAIAHAYGYESLVLGAWGCGAFGNDPWRTARDFRTALEGEFNGAFREVIFAITDWSEERRFIRPFCEVFSPTGPG